MLYLDADGFKAVNDRYGHAAGDRLLVEMSARLQAAVRSGDIVARLGGDEFAVLLQPLDSAEDGQRVAREITRLMQTPFDLGEHGRVDCGLSIGLALWPQDGNTVTALLEAADRAMYRAKQSHRPPQARLTPDEVLRP